MGECHVIPAQNTWHVRGRYKYAAKEITLKKIDKNIVRIIVEKLQNKLYFCPRLFILDIGGKWAGQTKMSLVDISPFDIWVNMGDLVMGHFS